MERSAETRRDKAEESAEVSAGAVHGGDLGGTVVIAVLNPSDNELDEARDLLPAERGICHQQPGDGPGPLAAEIDRSTASRQALAGPDGEGSGERRPLVPGQCLGADGLRGSGGHDAGI